MWQKGVEASHKFMANVKVNMDRCLETRGAENANLVWFNFLEWVKSCSSRAWLHILSSVKMLLVQSDNERRKKQWYC